MPKFEGGGLDEKKDDLGEETEGTAIKWDDLPLEARQVMVADMLVQVMHQTMHDALQGAAKLVEGVPPELVMSILNGAYAGLHRAAGFLEGDIIGNTSPEYRGANGETLEESLAATREKLRLLGRRERVKLTDAAKKAAADKASEPRIGFKMPKKSPGNDQAN